MSTTPKSLLSPVFWKHLASWGAFICYEQLIVYLFNGRLGPGWNFIYFYGLNISLFYSINYLLDKYISRAKPDYARLTLFVLLCMVFFIAVKGLQEYLAPGGTAMYRTNFPLFRKYLTLDALRSVYYAGLGGLYWSASHIALFKRQTLEAEIRQLDLARANAELETGLANARNAYLQQQLNPHLLFNTLNFIYNSIYKQSEEGGKAVLLLADIMRFSLSATDAAGKTALTREIEQLQNMVAINRYRYHFPLEINFSVKGDTDRYSIIPLILLTLVENIFKHGDFEGKSVTMSLAVTASGQLHFHTLNAKKQKSEPDLGRIGISNTRLRLDHAYGAHYSLEIHDTKTHFQTDLMIQL